MAPTTLPIPIGFAADDFQTKVQSHHDRFRFICVLCGTHDETWLASVGLFDGQEQLGIVCQYCLRAGQQEAAQRAREHAWELREWANQLDELAEGVAAMARMRWTHPAELDLAESAAWERAWTELTRDEGLG